MLMSRSLRFCFFVLACWLGVLPAQGQDVVYELSLQNTSLKTAIAQLEEAYGLLFSYEEAAVSGTMVSVQIKTDDLDYLLETLLKSTTLNYEQVDHRFIMLLPKGEQTSTDPVTHRFCGYVRDSLSGNTLAYANVYLKRAKVGDSTDDKGYFSFTGTITPQDTLIVSYVGYEDQRFLVQDFLSTSCPQITLSFTDFGENLVVVTDYLTKGVSLGNQGFSTDLKPANLPVLPGQVDPDVLQSLQFLPGVSSADGTLSNINIRGGTPDQNLILWEDIPIYHSAHYFGSISAFNPFAVDEINVFRGGFGADYGGRIAGIIDLKTEALNKSGLRGGTGSNLYSAFGHAQLTNQSRRQGVNVSLRRSQVGSWQAPFFNELRYRGQQQVLRGDIPPDELPPGIEITDEFQFWDVQLKYTAKVSDRDELNLAGLYAYNRFDSRVYIPPEGASYIDGQEVNHQGWKAEWQRQWTPAWQTILFITSTNYNYDYAFVKDFDDPERIDGRGQRDNEITEQQLRWAASYTRPLQGQLDFGYQLNRYQNDFYILEREEEVDLANQSGGVDALLHTLYATYNTAEQKQTGLRAGLRTNYYTNDDAIYWEPRLQFWHQLNADWRLTVATGQYHQFLSQLTEFKGAGNGISNPIWILADDRRVSVLSSFQAQVGLIYRKNNWLIDGQLYRKRSKGMSALAIGLLAGPQQGFDQGSSQVYGLDLLVKKRWGGFSSWLSYSLSEVNFEFPTFFDPQFPASYDQRHQLKWANVLEWKDWTFSLGWQWGSGLPYSLMRDFDLRPNPSGNGVNVVPIYDAYNGQRLRSLHQMDASVMYKVRRKDSPRWTGVIGLSLINIYDQANIYEREYFVENRPDAPRRILFEESVNLGVAPNFIFRMEWE